MSNGEIIFWGLCGLFAFGVLAIMVKESGKRPGESWLDEWR